jgi:hypothetical protein
LGRRAPDPAGFGRTLNPPTRPAAPRQEKSTTALRSTEPEMTGKTDKQPYTGIVDNDPMKLDCCRRSASN